MSRHMEEGNGGGRVMSIDALRGFDMFWIIGGREIGLGLAQASGNATVLAEVERQLEHVPWEGFAFYDLIMPLFLFVVGVAMPYSLARRAAGRIGKGRLCFHIAKRALILFVLGMIAQGNLLAYDLSQLHIYCNTLQAIATGYLIAAVLLLLLNVLGQIMATAGALLLYWGLMALVPTPGHEAGMLEPQANLAIWLDHLVLRGFQDGTSYTWILSSMVFACTVMLGALAGQFLRWDKRPCLKALGLLGMGAGLMAMGWCWGLWFPIIKHLWTSSFVLYSGGMCFLLLGLFYLVIDVWGLRKWAFGFVVIGMNCIAVYMATMLFSLENIGAIFVGSLEERLGQWYGFVLAGAGFGVLWLILWWMYRKKTFIRI